VATRATSTRAGLGDEAREARIRRALAARKRDLHVAVHDLATAARPTIWLADAIRRRPVQWFLVGFVAGILLARRE